MTSMPLTPTSAGSAASIPPFLDRTVRSNRYIPHWPTPAQFAFLLLQQREALYGGAAGGGKTDSLLMAALQYVDAPGYAAILFRQSYTDLDLPGALVPRSKEWLMGTPATWNGNTYTWSFPTGGEPATVSFAFLATDDQRFRYQGAEFQFIGFDELTQFSELRYTYLFSRLRRLTGVQIPLRARASSNPGGFGHEWVKDRFLVRGPVEGRPFVPALLEDNPYLDREEYEASLANLDPVTRLQLRRGDWDVRAAGNLFRREWFPIVDQGPARARRVRFWDKAATAAAPGTDPDWTVGVRVAEMGGQYWVEDVQRFRAAPNGVEARIRQTAELDGKGVIVGIEQEPGSAGVGDIVRFQQVVLAGWPCYGLRSTGDKTTRAAPVSSAAAAHNISLVRGPWIAAYLDEIEPFPTPKFHDDQVDATSGAFALVAQLRKQAPGQPVAGGERPTYTPR